MSKPRDAAFYFGTEAYCNGLSLNEYRHDIASKYGRASWDEMTSEERTEAKLAYHEGRAAEKANSR
jgi:hypothetical protein